MFLQVAALFLTYAEFLLIVGECFTDALTPEE